MKNKDIGAAIADAARQVTNLNTVALKYNIIDSTLRRYYKSKSSSIRTEAEGIDVVSKKIILNQ